MISKEIREAWLRTQDPLNVDSGLELAIAIEHLRHGYVHAEAMRRKAEFPENHVRFKPSPSTVCYKCVDPHHQFSDADWEAEVLKELND